MKNALRLGVAGLVCASSAAWAWAVPLVAPEPGTIELLAFGGIVGVIVALRKYRKKK